MSETTLDRARHELTTTPKEQRKIFFQKLFSLTTYDIELRAFDSKTKNTAITRFTRTLEGIEGFVSMNLSSRNIYFGVYSREGKEGKKENVREVTCYFADLDFKDYERGEAEAWERLKDFPIEPTVIIYSGNGLHVYWFLDKAIEPSSKIEAIQRGIAKKLKSDLSVCELARIMRIPGTYNYKDTPRKDVSLISINDNAYPPELFDQYEDKETVFSKERSNGSGELSGHIAEITGKCAFLKYCYEESATLLEPLWFQMVSNLSRYPVKPFSLVHEFSEHYPGYTPRETEQKMKHCLEDGGPHTCEIIKQTMKDHIGRDCGKACGVTSPVVLFTVKKKPSPRTTTSMSLTTLNELLKEPEENIPWLVEGILPAGGFSVLGAKPKVGKSTLARNLALCVVQGKPFLNRAVNQGPVIYYALEEKRAEVRSHFRDMGGGATGEENIYIYAGSAPLDALIQIREKAEEIKPVLIIIDPLFRMTRVKDGNDYAAVTQALEPILMLARETGTHVLCVHHAGKADRQGGDSLIGSTAIFGSVDTAMIMKRHEHYRTIQTNQRYGEDLEETTIHYDRETRTIEIGESKEQEDIATIEKAIMEFLSSHSEPVSEAVITEEVEGRTGLKRKALREQVREGKIKREGKGGKGDPYKYSCFVVPNIYREQGNKNPETDLSSENIKANACSRVFEEKDKDNNLREQESSGEIIDLEHEKVEEV